MVFVAHERRRIVHFNVTKHPNAAWIWRQLIEATPYGRQPACVMKTKTYNVLPRDRKALRDPARVPVVSSRQREACPFRVELPSRGLHRAVLAKKQILRA